MSVEMLIHSCGMTTPNVVGVDAIAWASMLLLQTSHTPRFAPVRVCEMCVRTCADMCKCVCICVIGARWHVGTRLCVSVVVGAVFVAVVSLESTKCTVAA